jgi:hypothetical protein
LHQSKKAAAANKCTSAAGHFDGHGGAPVQYEAHRPMQHDQGFTGSHWTPPSGNNSLRIAPLAARATINLTMTQHVLTLFAILMAIAMRRYYTASIAQQVFGPLRRAPYRLGHGVRTLLMPYHFQMVTFWLHFECAKCVHNFA